MNIFFQVIFTYIILISLVSCSLVSQPNQSTPAINTGAFIQTSTRLTGSVLPPEAQFKDLIKVLEDTKNYNEFSQKYSTISAKVDEWVLQGSGSYMFDHNIVDKLIPFLYICRLTLSGDENTIRSNFTDYTTIIPPIITNSPTSQDVISQFVSKKINLTSLYSILLSSEVSLPQYYVDLITSRKSTEGKIINNDCDIWISRYEKTFFSEK